MISSLIWGNLDDTTSLPTSRCEQGIKSAVLGPRLALEEGGLIVSSHVDKAGTIIGHQLSGLLLDVLLWSFMFLYIVSMTSTLECFQCDEASGIGGSNYSHPSKRGFICEEVLFFCLITGTLLPGA